MSTSRFAVPVLLAAALCIAFALMSCTESRDGDGASPSDSAEHPPAASPQQQAGSLPGNAETESAVPGSADPTPLNGEDVYAAANCAMCHGEELEGSKLAPALTGLSANWDKTNLIGYLIDPAGYTEQDERLKANKARYSLTMPGWQQTGLGADEMSILIDWLLE